MYLLSPKRPLLEELSRGVDMQSDNWNQSIALHALSDEAAVEILDFLHRFATDFENCYASQIHRYYAQRSQSNMITDPYGPVVDGEPF
jgi:hypothetical protein